MIKKVAIKNFMVHSELVIDDIPLINVIIGKNDTGKTGILKMLYATVKSLEIFSIKQQSEDVSYKNELAQKILNTFMSRNKGLGDLVQKGSKGKLDVNLTIGNYNNTYNQKLYYGFGDSAEKNIVNCIEHVDPIPLDTINALFIPAKEVLTAFNDILNIRDKYYGKGFDDTYLDLIKSLRLDPTKERVASELSSINKILEDLLEGKIEQTGKQDQPFIFKKGHQKFTMQQTAEGIKKIGILTTLITNREIGKGTVLFMDEPETTLHPDAVRKVVQMLVAMSRYGIQIFIASHSYFVIKQLALCAREEETNIKCWNFKKGEKNTVSNSFHDLIDGVLPSNSIIDEALRMYDQEIDIELNRL